MGQGKTGQSRLLGAARTWSGCSDSIPPCAACQWCALGPTSLSIQLLGSAVKEAKAGLSRTDDTVPDAVPTGSEGGAKAVARNRLPAGACAHHCFTGGFSDGA